MFELYEWRSNFPISVQLEESNITLTKDVENLSKEKAELSEKLRSHEEGILKLLDFISLLYWNRFLQTELLFSQSIWSAEGRAHKCNQSQLRKDPQYRAYSEDSGKDINLTWEFNTPRLLADSLHWFRLLPSVRRWTNWQRSWIVKIWSWTRRRRAARRIWGRRRRRTASFSWSLIRRKKSLTTWPSNTRKNSTRCRPWVIASINSSVVWWSSVVTGFKHDVLVLQQLAEECTNRNDLQMQLDSKESDIEQLREKLNDLQQRMENSSITSLQTDETDSNIAGMITSVWSLFLRSTQRLKSLVIFFVTNLE